MHNLEIRRKVLEMLYEKCEEHPYARITPKEFRETLGINLRELNFNMIYLESKGYVELQKLLEGGLFVGARITAKGVDLVEDEYEFSVMFSVSDAKPLPAIVFSQFASLVDEVKAMHGIGEQTRELLIAHIEEIAEEIKKSSTSYSVVKQHVVAIRKLDDRTASRLVFLLQHPFIAGRLTKSARQELENP